MQEQRAIKAARSSQPLRGVSWLGIDLAAADERFTSKQARIHVILGGIDLRLAAERGKREMDGRAVRPYASSELRAIYRQWSRMRHVVYFYVNVTPVDAPWDADWELPSISELGVVSSARGAWPR